MGRYFILSLVVSLVVYPIFFAISFFIIHKITTWYYARKTKAAYAILSEHKTVVIAVVGSYGKTTMKHILAEILASQGLSCSYTPGTVNTLEGIVQWVCDVYATDPTEYCIIEMGEHYVGDISAICKAVPVNHAIITGATFQHYERFGSGEAIVQTLLEVVQYVKDDGVILYNADSDLFVENYKIICPASDHFIPYAKSDCEDVVLLPDMAGTQFLYQGKRYTTKLLGYHIPPVIIACLKLLEQLDITYDVYEAINKIEYIEHRMQLRYNPQTDITILDDAYNANLEGYKAMISLLKETARRGPVIYVTPGILEVGTMSSTLHEQIAKELLNLALSSLWLIKTKSSNQLKYHLQKLGYTGTIHEFPFMYDALELLPQYAGEHCLVVIQNDWPELYSYL